MKRLSVVIVVVLVLSLTACGQAPDSQNPDLGEELVIRGLTEEPLTVPVSEIRELEQVSGNANTINSSNEASQREYVGVKIDTVLAGENLDLEGVTALVVNAGDGYSVEIPQEILNTREIILAWEIDGSPLEGRDGPFRVVIPDERSLYWVRNVTELVFVRDAVQNDITDLVFFENLYPNMQTQVYPYYGSEDLAVDLSQLVDTDQVTLVARDGLTKNENLRSDVSYFIKAEGDDAPLFISPSIPKGMYVKNLGLVLHDSQAVIFAGSFLDGNNVDMAGVLELLGSYLGEGSITLTAGEDSISVTPAEIADLNFMVTEQGVIFE